MRAFKKLNSKSKCQIIFFFEPRNSDSKMHLPFNDNSFQFSNKIKLKNKRDLK